MIARTKINKQTKMSNNKNEYFFFAILVQFESVMGDIGTSENSRYSEIINRSHFINNTTTQLT